GGGPIYDDQGRSPSPNAWHRICHSGMAARGLRAAEGEASVQRRGRSVVGILVAGVFALASSGCARTPVPPGPPEPTSPPAARPAVEPPKPPPAFTPSDALKDLHFAPGGVDVLRAERSLLSSTAGWAAAGAVTLRTPRRGRVALALHPAAVDHVALVGAGVAVVGGQEEDGARDVRRHQLALEALAAHQLLLTLRREPEGDLPLGHDPA